MNLLSSLDVQKAEVLYILLKLGNSYKKMSSVVVQIKFDALLQQIIKVCVVFQLQQRNLRRRRQLVPVRVRCWIRWSRLQNQ